MSTNVIDLRHALKRGRCSHDETDSKAHNARHCLMTWSKLSDVFLLLPANTLLVLLFRDAPVVNYRVAIDSSLRLSWSTNNRQ